MNVETPVRSLVAITEATRMLAEAKTLEDVRGIRDLAEAARVYARAHDLGIEAEQHAAEIKVYAEHKAGELLRLTAERGERHRPGDPGTTFQGETSSTLADLGIDRVQSHRWQTIAALPEPELREYVEETKAAGRVPTSAGAYERAKHRLAPLMSSETPEWYTPPEVIACVVLALGGIDLDPCSNSKDAPRIPAARHFTVEDDGLAQPWGGRVYMNPPYGREIGDWIAKLAAEHKAGRVPEAIALVPARTDTGWWRALPARYACFVTGRLTFSDHDNAAPFPSAALYLGDNPERFVAAFADLGDLWSRIEVPAA